MIDEKKLTDAVKELHKQKKNFSQSYDLTIALKDLNLKDPKEQVEFFAQLPHKTGRKVPVCALVGPEMIDEARKTADKAIEQSEFDKLKKGDVRKIAKECEYFVGQANIMPKIAAAFGRVLGPRGKMPNPKAGCIVPPKAPLAPLIDKLQSTVKVSARKSPTIQIRVGTQGMSESAVIDNVKSAYDQIIHHLPREENNIKAVYFKLTMSPPIKLR